MTNAQLLLTLIVVQQGLLGLVWLGAAALGLARAPALHWGLSTVAVAACLGLVTLRDQPLSLWVTFAIPNVCGVAAFVLLRRGVQLFAGLPPTDREHALVVAAAAVAVGAAIATEAPIWTVVVFTSLGLAFSQLRAGVEAVATLGPEFGRRAAVLCAAPLLVVGAMFVLRAALAPVFTEQIGRSITVAGQFNASFGVVTLAMTLLQNMALGAMVVIRTVSQLRRLSDHDPLTGALNRRGLEAQHGRERARLRRGGAGYALLWVDVDHFKRVNDAHGHFTGDAALVAIASTLRDNVRPSDVVARTGGEEFCVLLPGVDAQSAREAAQRLRQAVRDAVVRTDAACLQLTCSVGLAWTRDPDESLHSVVQRADQALYRAKSEGRDRVVEAQPALAGRLRPT